MKSTDTFFVLASVALVGAAVWMFARRGDPGAAAFAAANAPPASLRYHAANNPNGYVFIPSGFDGGGQWTKVTPEGQPVYWADVL